MAPSILKTDMSIFGDNFIRLGWRELHSAALRRGAEVEYDPEDRQFLDAHSCLDGNLYSALIGGLPARIGINLGPGAHLQEEVSSLVWKALEAKGRQLAPVEWNEILHETNPHGLMNAFRSRPFLVEHPTNPKLIQRESYTLARSALAILAFDASSQTDYVRAAIWALACIGAVSHSIRHRGLCEFCFRLTWPEQRFCRFHSQAKPYQDGRANAYLRYRRGRNAYMLAKSRSLLGKIKGGPMAQSLKRLGLMADLLFPLLPDSDDERHDRPLLCGILASHPRTLALLGGQSVLEMPFAGMTEVLREKLDPEEWDNLAWGSKIVASELWLALEEEVAPGRKMCSRKTESRMLEAQQMFDQGMKSREIAAKLGISPSAISKWKARKPEFLNARSTVDGSGHIFNQK